MNEFRTQPLRHFDVMLTTTGEVITKPTKLYKGSYGFITLRCFVPMTQNYVENETVPVVKVCRVITDKEGVRVSDRVAYPMFFVENVNIDGYGYSLHECLMPKPFTESAGDLEMIFSYYEGRIGEDGKITYDNLLMSKTVVAPVEDGGIMADTLDVPEGNEWHDRINTVLTNVNSLDEELGKTNKKLDEELGKTNEKIDNLTVERGTRVTENGEVVETFDADTKLDKLTGDSYKSRLYGTNHLGNFTMRQIGEQRAYSGNGSIPMYVTPGATSGTGWTSEPYGSIFVHTPLSNWEAAPKKYVDWKTVQLNSENPTWNLPTPASGKKYLLTIYVRQQDMRNAVSLHSTTIDGDDMVMYSDFAGLSGEYESMDDEYGTVVLGNFYPFKIYRNSNSDFSETLGSYPRSFIAPYLKWNEDSLPTTIIYKLEEVTNA